MPPPVECPSLDVLTEFHGGRLDEPTWQQVAHHVEACTTCQARLGALDRKPPTTLRQALQSPVRAEAAQAASGGPAVLDSEATVERRLGPYRLQALLGQGGMGQVFRAEHFHLRRTVAIKLIPIERTRDQHFVARFQREMAAVGRLDHSGIVRATDAGEIDGQHYLVLDFVDGLELGELVRRLGPLPVAESSEIIRQAALALDYAHQHHLVHRDVKPSNLMLTRRGEVKLLDLGLALPTEGGTSLEELTHTGQLLGTIDYMAPEQADSPTEVDGRADLYSLGCTLWKLLTGRVPFSAQQYPTVAQRLMAHREAKPPPLNEMRGDVPRELNRLIASLLAKQPGDRPPTGARLAQLLAPWATGARLDVLFAQAEGAKGDPAAALVGSGDLDTDRGRTGSLTDARRPAMRRTPGRRHVRQYLVWSILVVLAAAAIWVYRQELARSVAPLAENGHSESSSSGAAPDGTEAVRLSLPWMGEWRPGPEDDEPLSGLIPRPAKLPGLHRWQIETRAPHARPDQIGWQPGGKLLAVGDDDGQLRIYSVDDGQLLTLMQLPSHVNDLAWSRSGQRLATGTSSGALTVLTAQGEVIRQISVPANWVGHLAWSSDDRRIVTSGYDLRLRIWDLETGSELGEPIAVDAVVDELDWSADGRWLAARSRRQSDGTNWIRLWDLENPTQVVELPPRAEESVAWYSLAFRPDGGQLATVARVDQKEFRIDLWTPAGEHQGSSTNDRMLWSLQWSPDGRHLAGVNGFGGVQALSMPDGKPIAEWVCPSEEVISFAVSSDSTEVALATRQFGIWVHETNPGEPGAARPLARCEFIRPRQHDHHPSGRVLATAALDGAVSIWPTDQPAAAYELGRHDTQAHSVDFRADKNHLASSGGETAPTVWIWDWEKRSLLHELKGHEKFVHEVTYLPRSDQAEPLVASASEDGTVRLWRSDSDEVMAEIPVDRPVYCLAWDSQLGRLAAGDSAGFVHTWMAPNWAATAPMQKETDPILALTFFSRGEYLVAAQSNWEKGFRFWHANLSALSRGMSLLVPVGRTVIDLDGDRIACGTDLGQLFVWDRREQRIAWFPQAGRSPVVTVRAALPDPWFSVSRQSGTLELWDLSKPEMRWLALRRRDGGVVVFNGGGQLMTAPESASDLVFLVESQPGKLDIEDSATFLDRFSSEETVSTGASAP